MPKVDKWRIVSKDQPASITTCLVPTLFYPFKRNAGHLKDALDYKLPVLVHTTPTADEQPGIDINRPLNTFATKEKVTFNTTDEAGNAKTVTLDIPTVNKFIFYLTSRKTRWGCSQPAALATDSIQTGKVATKTNPEVRIGYPNDHKWNPTALCDYTVLMQEFWSTCNYMIRTEYEVLLSDDARNAHHKWRHGVTILNTIVTSFQTDWGDGWMTPSLAIQGFMFTMESAILSKFQKENEELAKAGRNAVLVELTSSTKHPWPSPDASQLYLRGLTKPEDPKLKNELGWPKWGAVDRVKWRPKFFPDYYVIPVDFDKDNDALCQYDRYFKRNGACIKKILAM